MVTVFSILVTLPTLMGIAIGGVKYFIGMATSVWGLVTAFLFAQTVLEPLDYIEGFLLFLKHGDEPYELLIGLFELFITTPGDAIGLVLFGLVGMTILWMVGMARSR